MDKKSWLDKLHYDFDKQRGNLELAYLQPEGPNSKWIKHIDAQADEKFIERANNRTILPNEIVIDIEESEQFQGTLEQIKIDFEFYSAYSTGSRGYHIHLFFDEPVDKENKKEVIEIYNGDKQKATERTMIALENCPHWKTGKNKILVEEVIGFNPVSAISKAISRNTIRLTQDSFLRIKKILRKYIDTSEENYSLISLWIIGTYTHSVFSSYPYLFFNAMKGSGKSRTIKLIICLSYNGRLVMDLTDAVLFRTAKGSTLGIDEASRVPEQVWNEALRPTLTDKKGEVLLISTPQGMNWFQQAFVRGQDPNEKDYQSWQFPSGTNPHLPQDEIEEAKRTLPERVFKQEYLAEFVSDAGTVFRNVDNCIKGAIEGPQPNTRYIIGVDLGKFQDFTALVVLKREAGHSRIVYFDRFNKIDWNLQKTKIQAISKRYNNALTIIDSTGVGDAVFTDLSQMRVNVRGFRIKSNEIKCQLIENLIIAIENEEISFPNIPELINELKIFNYEYSEISGKTHYNAPSGFHDDCVIALALAYKFAKTQPLIVVTGSKSFLTHFPAQETIEEKIERLKKQWKTNEVTITNG